ncbi:MAG: GGDEF domain-containing protein [Clostridiales bacterium]|nr:GGDEF domain-containing protein [Clostridiales bacterium]
MVFVQKLKKWKYEFLAIVLVVIYLCSFLMSQCYFTDIQQFEILGIKVNNVIAMAIRTQIQMLFSVLVALLCGRKYFLLVVLINLLSLTAFIALAVSRKSDAIMLEILFYTVVLLVVSLIYVNIKKMKSRITKLEAKEKELRKLAFFDGLTGILNRNTFIYQLDFHIDCFLDKNVKMYVIFIDVDDFKKINDTYGHFAGDAVIKEVALRIKNVIDEEDIVGRLGGDEIGIIIKRNIDSASARAYINCIRQAISSPYVIDKEELLVTVSMGVAEFPSEGTTSSELLKKADTAMYHAKAKGKNRIIYFSDNKI